MGKGWKEVEVYVAQPGQKKYRTWKCPTCGLVYESPIPVFDVECGRNRKHPQKQVRMQPGVDSEANSTPRPAGAGGTEAA